MDKKKEKPLDIKFKMPWKDMVNALTGELLEGVTAVAEKEFSAKMKKMLVNAAMEYFSPYGIPMSQYKASVEMSSEVTAEVIFTKKDNPEITLVLGDIYFDESTGIILQATPQLG